jgi:hypothetical protein
MLQLPMVAVVLSPVGASPARAVNRLRDTGEERSGTVRAAAPGLISDTTAEAPTRHRISGP